MGGRRKKLKDTLSPPPNAPPPVPATEDEELLDDLLAQLDSSDKTVQNVSAEVINDIQLSQLREQEPQKPKKDSKTRFLERQARKAAGILQHHPPDDPEADAQIEREAREEEASIIRTCKLLNLELHQVNPDGHCLFASVADQLVILGILPRAQANYAVTRTAAANYIYTHPDDFLPFLPSINGEDGVGATDAGLITPKQFEIYCASIRDTGVWGGEPEILALSRAYNIPIHVIQSGNPPVVVHNPTGGPGQEDGLDKTKKVVRISYHRRMYGLGEHYNSLRPKKGLVETLMG